MLEKAWLAIQRNARSSKSEDTRNEIATFASDLNNNLRHISRQLQKQNFKFPPAKGVKIPKDKKDKSNFRPLVVAKVESRVVQRAIHDVLVTVPAINLFVRTPHSFGGIKKNKEDDISAVPAAIQAVLNAIGNGGTYVIRSDIKGFFTNIRKSTVTNTVSQAVENDGEFMDIFTKAIAVELENMAQLRSAAKAFPIEDIGVAQGNSLSPLLGNILLYDFDKALNKADDVRCIRYIDDFIILAPKQSVAENTFSKAVHLLRELGMDTSPGKTQKATVQAGFEFLGIDICNGIIRPGKKSRERMISSVTKTLDDSARAFREHKATGDLNRLMSLLYTLNKVSGIMQGWSKHYRFCNDGNCLKHLDGLVSELVKKYLSIYRKEREDADDIYKWKLLGIEAISQVERTPFVWPTRRSLQSAADANGALLSSQHDPNSLPWD